MHHIAEFYQENADGSINETCLEALIQEALSKWVLEEEQIVELRFMARNIVEKIWPELMGRAKDDPFTPSGIVTEYNVRGDVVYNDAEQQPWLVPLNQKIDRYVRTDDGRVIIIDYKKGKRSVNNHLFQLLFYVTTISQKLRVPITAIEIWLVFPNEKANHIEKVSGRDLQDEIPTFLEHMAELISKHNQVTKKGAVSENDATPSFLCNFCMYQATDFCPLSKMMHGGKIAEAQQRVFETGYKVKRKVEPKEVLSSSTAW